jgi:DNA-binding FadR family transcriptional regulator
MTRQNRSPIDPLHAKRALLRPLPPARNLTHEVIARIKKEIGAGRLAPGTRLPTEQELMAALGVSRTVVREAVSALRADGLIMTRQGSGAYVAADVSRVPSVSIRTASARSTTSWR